MSTLKESITAAIYSNSKLVNGDRTEEMLVMAISEKIAVNKIKNATMIDENSFIGKPIRIKSYECEKDTGSVEVKGAWVYKEGDMMSWTFDRYKSIGDAVKAAVKLINAKVICNGKVIKYDRIDDNTAYYLDEHVGKLKIVEM